jgi:pimeloyl-ACP methyl ester carboxylesterase
MLARHSRVVGAVAALLLLLSACAWIRGDSGPRPLPSPDPTAELAVVGADLPKGLLSFYKQPVDWYGCEEFDCADVQVPLDYDDPGGTRITLAMKRLRAGDPGNRVGSLLINPGGPGVSGIELAESASMTFSDALLDAFDVVGFDPRGVGKSTPIECLDPAELDELRAAVYDTRTQSGRDSLRADARQIAQACQAKSSDLLPHVGTVDAARDMDILRAVLGDAQLYYLGYSYGSLLGATYADLFPERVGRLVLDGAVDPTLTHTGLGYGQAAGFEAALRAYVADCLDGRGCPLSGSVEEGVSQVQRFIALTAGSPLPTASGRSLTQSLAVSGILLTLYDDRYWPVLSEALTAAIRDDDGSQLLFLADLVADREEDGTYSSNSTVAFTAVNCLDLPVDASPAAMDAAATRLRELSPTFGDFLAYGEIICDEWPVAPTGDTGALRAEGAGPILVIGTTRDPATPYAWAESLADQLESGMLITFDGEGHTAYGRSNDCIEDAVDAYLTRGELPVQGLRC